MGEDNRNQQSTEGFDRVIHERARLGIMAMLVGGGDVEFTALKKALLLTDGNLNAHLKVLEKNGYVTETKQFVGKRPRTGYQATEKGVRAFREYVSWLEQFLKSIA
jgi:DNA-binding HxlR family transcriptional regulator